MSSSFNPDLNANKPVAATASSIPQKAKAFLNNHKISLVILAVGAAILLNAGLAGGHFGSIPDFMATLYKTAGFALGGIAVVAGGVVFAYESTRTPKKHEFEILEPQKPAETTDTELTLLQLKNKQRIRKQKLNQELPVPFLSNAQREQIKAEGEASIERALAAELVKSKAELAQLNPLSALLVIEETDLQVIQERIKKAKAPAEKKAADKLAKDAEAKATADKLAKDAEAKATADKLAKDAEAKATADNLAKEAAEKKAADQIEANRHALEAAEKSKSTFQKIKERAFDYFISFIPTA